MSDPDADFMKEYREWRMRVRNDFEAFLQYREMKRKADLYDERSSATGVGPVEDSVREGSPEDSRPE